MKSATAHLLQNAHAFISNACAAPSARRHRVWPLAALFLALSACGPGVGGTGTDSVPDAFTVYQASNADVCNQGELGGLLGCTTATSAAGPTSVVVFVEDSARAEAVARYQGQTVDLELRCLKGQFEGRWGVVVGLGSRFYGVWRADGQPGEAASLAVVVDASGRQTLSLRDTHEQTIWGPKVMVGSAGSVPAAKCP